MDLLHFFIKPAYALGLGDFTNIIQPYAGNDFQGLISKLIGWAFTAAALVAFIYLLVAGFNYITAGGDSDKASKGGKGITNALIGIIVIIAAYTLVRFVGSGLLGSNSANITPTNTSDNSIINSLPTTQKPSSNIDNTTNNSATPCADGTIPGPAGC